jgi:hypothetical protein
MHQGPCSARVALAEVRRKLTRFYTAACRRLGAELDTTVETPLRRLGLVQDSVHIFGFGLFEQTMVVSC